MPVDKDLKKAYNVLYDEADPLKALKLYDDILTEHSGNLIATIYKAAALEKLYYGFADWHNSQTLESAEQLLSNALKLAQDRGDRSKLGLVCFRHFIHYYNDKDFDKANVYMDKCKEYGYKDNTLPMWEAELDRKLKKRAKKTATKVEKTETVTISEPVNKELPAVAETTPVALEEKLRTDWYQTSSDVVLSLLTSRLPQADKDVTIQVSKENKRSVEISYLIPASGSEFQYAIRLAHEVKPDQINVKVFTKKIEITFKKEQKIQWKTIEDDGSEITASSTAVPDVSRSNMPLNYPSSSKKQVDWSKIDLDDDNDAEGSSADAFFQKLYADADPDTKRAMMKSFIESNGTALNTNWEDVSKEKVEISPPEGMEAKDW